MQNNGWQRALDTQMDLLKWHQADIGEAFTMNFFNNILRKEVSAGMPASPAQIAHDVYILTRNINEMLWRGDTMYVTTDMQHIMLQAAHDLPDEYVFDPHTLLCPIGFCMFEESMHGVDRNGLEMGVSALSWCSVRASRDGDEVDTALVLCFWTDMNDPGDTFNSKIIPMLIRDDIPIPPMSLSHYYVLRAGDTVRPGKASGNPQGSELVDGVLTLFAALNILAAQKIGEPIKITPDRATRRRYARDWTNAPERLITLITLRRKSACKPAPDAPLVPWSRRWIVRGHWRKQPDKNGWHWTYIYEYIKGPEDKPLIISERRVFNFRR